MRKGEGCTMKEEILSQEWIERNTSPVDDEGRLYIWKRDLESLIIPKKEITEEQVMDWLDKNEFYDHITAETVLEKAVDKGELSYYGTKYSVIEAPVIPRFVAEWIIRHRGTYDLYPALRMLENNTLVWSPIYEWYRMNTYKFVNAYLTGEYEVEEEQKYNVKIKARSSAGTVGVFLYKRGNEVLAGDNFKAYYPEKDKFRLTEQEIKNFDPICWKFRKPV